MFLSKHWLKQKESFVIILVDFENTHASGLEGYTYLNENDTLVMYYSDENSAVTRGVVEDLRTNGVHVRLVKLLKQHSNALDMYIASTTGMYLDSGEKICIVSKDHGYAAVRDFWHSLRGAEILLGETIKECFLHSELNDEARIRLCKEREKKATLVEAFTTMNTIPTRPTLSRGAQRRRRNETRNFTEMSEPVAILPNPLVTETPADQLARKLIASSAEEKATVKEQEASGSRTEAKAMQHPHEAEETVSSEAAAMQPKAAADHTSSETAGSLSSRSRERNTRRDRGSRYTQTAAENGAPQETAEPVQERFGGYDGIMKVNEASRLANARRQERAENARQDTAGNDHRRTEQKQKPQATPEASTSVISEMPKAALEAVPTETPKALVPTEKKSTAVAKFDPNRVQFVWDPITHSMKKVGAPEEAEATDAGTSEEKKKAAEAVVNETATEEKKTEEVETGAAETSVKAEEVPEAPKAETVEASDAAETAESVEQPEDVQEETAEEAAPQQTAEDAASREDTAEKPVKKTRSRRSKKTKKAENEEAPQQTASEENASKPRSGKKTPQEETAAAKKPRKTRAAKKTAAAEKPAVAEADEGKALQKPEKAPAEASEAMAITLSPETLQEAKRKYGDGANTLHTYYIRLMKAFGRGQGKAIYEETKKSVQEDIKSRKMQAAAADAEA